MIPVLLVDGRRRLVKTVRFGERTYVGDPFNVVPLFNEKEVDEICVLDIDASTQGRAPDFDFIRALSSECFMPLAYGGGIKTLAHCEQLSRLGVEKLVVGESALDQELVRVVSPDLGTQALVACVDVVGQSGAARCVTGSAQHDIGRKPLEYCQQLQDSGVGESSCSLWTAMARAPASTSSSYARSPEVSGFLWLRWVALARPHILCRLCERVPWPRLPGVHLSSSGGCEWYL